MFGGGGGGGGGGGVSESLACSPILILHYEYTYNHLTSHFSGPMAFCCGNY